MVDYFLVDFQDGLNGAVACGRVLGRLDKTSQAQGFNVLLGQTALLDDGLETAAGLEAPDRVCQLPGAGPGPTDKLPCPALPRSPDGLHEHLSS